MMKPPCLVIISAVRNEVETLPRTIESVRRQTVRPARWIIVDDGSNDGTKELATELAQAEPWVEVVSRKDRGFRQSGIGVVEAFYQGFSQVSSLPWDYISKLDGDISLQDNYFEALIGEFARRSDLGIASGEIYADVAGSLVLDSPNDPVFHVRGAAKVYRRECWDAIGGIPKVTGFDCIDNLKARMLGWQTQRFATSPVTHLRPTGAANGTWRNSVKDGIGANAVGYHPAFLFLKCAKRFSGGAFVGAFGQFYGYIKGYFSEIPRITDRNLVKYVRRQQINRLLGRESIWR